MTEPGRLAEPRRTPARIAAARKKASALGLPFTPDMTAEEALAGVRAVDGMGRVGSFRMRDFASSRMLMFVSDDEAGIPPAATERET